MTNDLPTGRALDEAVAKAMGWGNICRGDASTLIGNRPTDLAIDVVPAYSTDYAALPEMLAWLSERNAFPTLREGCLKGWEGSAVRYNAKAFNQDRYIQETGATVPELVARLVLAVGASNGKA